MNKAERCHAAMDYRRQGLNCSQCLLAAFRDRVYYKTENCFKFYQFIDAADEADFNNAISNFRSKALYDTGVTAQCGDLFLTLVTCAYQTENGRFVVVARKK